MITTTGKASEKLEAMFAALEGVGADVSVHNRETGEVLHPDASAMFAGIQAGLVVASDLIDRPKLLDSEVDGFIAAAIRTASKQYIRRYQSKRDEVARAIAAQESEGKEDAER